MKKANFYLPDRQMKQLKLVSNLTELSVAEHVRRAIDLYMSSGMVKDVIEDSEWYSKTKHTEFNDNQA